MKKDEAIYLYEKYEKLYNEAKKDLTDLDNLKNINLQLQTDNQNLKRENDCLQKYLDIANAQLKTYEKVFDILCVKNEVD